MTLLLEVNYPDNEGPTEYELADVGEARTLIASIQRMPWITPPPTWYLWDANGELLEDGP